MFLDVPVVFGLARQLTDTRGRRRRKATGSLLSRCSMSAVGGNLLGTVSLILERWRAGGFQWLKKSHYHLLPLVSPGPDTEIGGRERERERERG